MSRRIKLSYWSTKSVNLFEAILSLNYTRFPDCNYPLNHAWEQIVISIQENHDFSSTRRESGITRRRHPAVLLQHRDDLILVVSDELSRVVSRAIVHHDDLNVGVRLV
jgi:hypothetical protein